MAVCQERPAPVQLMIIVELRDGRLTFLLEVTINNDGVGTGSGTPFSMQGKSFEGYRIQTEQAERCGRYRNAMITKKKMSSIPVLS